MSFLACSMFSCKSPKEIPKESESHSLRYLNAVFEDYLNEYSTFLDRDNNEISKEKFAVMALTPQLIGAKVDSSTFKIILSKNHGEIGNPNRVLDILSEFSEVKFNPLSPIVIVYYPGLDGCSETGFTNRSWTKSHFKNFESELQKLGNTKAFYFYKHPVEFEKFKGIIDWEKDPKGAFEELFFPYHCPCGGYAIMGTNGDYFVQHGEYSTDYLLEKYKLILRNQSKN